MKASYDALVELFRRIRTSSRRLMVYSQFSLTAEMAEVVLVKIVAEILSILSIATKEVKRKGASEFLEELLRARAFSYMVRILFRESVREDRYRGCVQKA